MSNIIYLNNSATSFPKPENVYQAIDNFRRNWAGSPDRSGLKSVDNIANIVSIARNRISAFFNSPNPSRVVFTYNATDALNIAILGILKPGDKALSTMLEHNSVLRPLNHLKRDGRIDVEFVEPSGETITVERIKKAITPNTRIVVLTHASNVTGWIQPIKAIGNFLKQQNIIFIVDATQTAGILPIDVQKMNIDVLVFTGHKALMGPVGIGGMIVAPDVEIEPLRVGGSGIYSEDKYHPSQYPYRLEAGTPNVPAIVGLNEGIKFIRQVGLDNIYTKELELISILKKGLSAINKITLYTSTNIHNGTGILSFTIEGFSSTDIATILESEFNIAVRAGLHCAPSIHRYLGTFPNGTIRVSPGYFNTAEDIEAVIEAVATIAD